MLKATTKILGAFIILQYVLKTELPEIILFKTIRVLDKQKSTTSSLDVATQSLQANSLCMCYWKLGKVHSRLRRLTNQALVGQERSERQHLVNCLYRLHDNKLFHMKIINVTPVADTQTTIFARINNVRTKGVWVWWRRTERLM